MKKRTIIRPGSIFRVEIDKEYKVYFQFVVRDLYALNSEVIRVFHKRWSIGSSPSMEMIVRDEVGFYTHTFIRPGIDANAWDKVGTFKERGLDELTKVIFGVASVFQENNTSDLIDVNPLENWWIGKVNEEGYKVGHLPDELVNVVEIGTVMPYTQIIDRIKYGYFTATTPSYGLLPRRPWPDTWSYVRIPEDVRTVYLEFLGEEPQRMVVERDGRYIDLTPEQPEKDGERFSEKRFTEYVFMYPNFISAEDFEKVADLAKHQKGV